MNRFFQSRIWRAMDFLGTIFLINAMWLVCCIPILTIGASTAAMCHCYFRLYGNRAEPLFRLFKNGLKGNARQATAVWLVYLVFLIDAGIVWWTKRRLGSLPPWAESRAALAIAVVVTLVAAFTAVYIFAVMACYECSTWQCFLNALGLSFRFPAQTLLLALLSAGTAAAVWLAPFMALLLPSACGAIQCRILSKLFRRQEDAMKPKTEEGAEAEHQNGE